MRPLLEKGESLAKLIPYKTPAKPRKLGMLQGKTWEAEDAWSKEADAELAAEFLGAEEESPEFRPARVAEDPA